MRIGRLKENGIRTREKEREKIFNGNNRNSKYKERKVTEKSSSTVVKKEM